MKNVIKEQNSSEIWNMSAANNYEKANLPSRMTAVRIANGYLQERIYNGSNQRIIFEHGIHVFNVAKIAENIAAQTKQLDPDIAYKLGLLHDIGRIKDETVTKVPHSIEGYNYLRKIGFPDAAPICITHNFIDPEIKKEDYPTYDEESFAAARNFLQNVRYNDYDRLIQLADLFSRGKEILSIRQRLDKNKQFYKIKNLSYEDKAFGLRDYFNKKYNIDVEQIVADTFNMHKQTHTNDDRAVFLIIPPAQNMLVTARKRSII